MLMSYFDGLQKSQSLYDEWKFGMCVHGGRFHLSKLQWQKGFVFSIFFFLLKETCIRLYAIVEAGEFMQVDDIVFFV
jgi:hypothetical protein